MHSRGRTSFFLSLLTRPSPARFRKLEQISFVSTRVIRRITFHSTLLFTSKRLGRKPSVLNTSGRGLPSPNQFDSDDILEKSEGWAPAVSTVAKFIHRESTARRDIGLVKVPNRAR